MADTNPSLDDVFTQYGVDPNDLARSLNVTPEAVRCWRRGLRRLPPGQAKIIEERFGVPKHLLRPDLWDPPPPVKRRSSATA